MYHNINFIIIQAKDGMDILITLLASLLILPFNCFKPQLLTQLITGYSMKTTNALEVWNQVKSGGCKYQLPRKRRSMKGKQKSFIDNIPRLKQN